MLCSTIMFWCFKMFMLGLFLMSYGTHAHTYDQILKLLGLAGIANYSAVPNVPLLNDVDTVKACPLGFKAVKGICEDIDECSTPEEYCASNQICDNTVGGYNCTCPGGYKAVHDNCKNIEKCSPNAEVCVDIDECAIQDSSQSAVCELGCTNSWGSYICDCNDGYNYNLDNRTCDDINECAYKDPERLCVGGCINEPGSYKCTCPTGYTLSNDRRNCTDIDECATGQAGCSSHATCFNIQGSAACPLITCDANYTYYPKWNFKGLAAGACSINKATNLALKSSNALATEFVQVDRRCFLTCEDGSRTCGGLAKIVDHKLITFVSNVTIPDGGLKLTSMYEPPMYTNEFSLTIHSPTDFSDHFDLKESNSSRVVTLIKPVIGPQYIVGNLTLVMRENNTTKANLTKDELFGKMTQILHIYVSEYDF